MIYGIGNDIIEISRIKRSIERHGERFLNRLFTPTEQRYCEKYRLKERHFAGRFAAKEAVVKALGTGFQEGISWIDLEILNDEKGKPYVTFSTNFLKKIKNPNIILSISHCHEYATAVAIWTR